MRPVVERALRRQPALLSLIGRPVSIEAIDHVIVEKEGLCSFRAEALLSDERSGLGLAAT
jgi:hypothetical protein